MKKTFLILMLICFIANFTSEGILGDEETGNSGVKFEQLSFKETLTRAVKQNKLVLIDVFSHG